MALTHGGPYGMLSDESKGTVEETIRDYEPAHDTQWRFGLPDYTQVNKAYFQHRSKHHAAGSLEAVVQKIVKNWEVESHHISDINQWRTMDVPNFKAFSNGAGPVDAATMCAVGPYNMLLGKVANYDGTKETFESANDVFRATFTEGFAFEVLEVFSPPPNVSFTWRHFGRMSGPYKGCPADGKMVEVIGHCLARVNKDLVIEELSVHFDRESFISDLVSAGIVSDEVKSSAPSGPEALPVQL